MGDSSISVAFCWEIGGGLGHVTPIQPIATKLLEAGERVSIIARHPRAVAKVFGSRLDQASERSSGQLRIFTAPHQFDRPLPPRVRLRSIAEVYLHAAFDDVNEAAGRIAVWTSLFDAHRITVVVADHAPTALLAARVAGLPVIELGTPFSVPPILDPPPPFPGIPIKPERDRESSQRLLDVMNNAAENESVAQASERSSEVHAWQPLRSVSDLFAKSTERFLWTDPALDPIGHRTRERFIGLPERTQTAFGSIPTWPQPVSGASSSRRVLVYLKSPQAIGRLERELGGTANSVLVLQSPGNGGGPQPPPNILSPPELLPFEQVAAAADVAIIEGGASTTIQCLRAATPVVFLPSNFEQAITAEHVASKGCGSIAHRTHLNEAIARAATQQSRVSQFARELRDDAPATATDAVLAAIRTATDSQA